MVEATSSLALFAVVWAVVCLLSGALVTDAMLRDTNDTTVHEADATPTYASDDASA